MTRNNIAAGNWKMNHTLPEAIAFMEAFINEAPTKAHPSLIFPAFPFIATLSEMVKNHPHIRIGAQNCSAEVSGAFTGEVSPEMIRSVGATHVIIGHSERRAMYHEDNAWLAKKVDAAFRAGITPVYCCGEPLEVRNENEHFNLVKEQISEGLFHLSAEAFAQVVIAYEPVWAIGTGVTASPEQAQEMHAFIRGVVAEKYGADVAANTTILYGGSVKASNAEELFNMPDVDGGLVGGASLKVSDFVPIVAALKN